MFNHFLLLTVFHLLLGSYELMLECLQGKPDVRPIFSELKCSLAAMLQNNNVCVIIKCFYRQKQTLQ